jgi:hypothetical protein
MKELYFVTLEIELGVVVFKHSMQSPSHASQQHTVSFLSNTQFPSSSCASDKQHIVFAVLLSSQKVESCYKMYLSDVALCCHVARRMLTWYFAL